LIPSPALHSLQWSFGFSVPIDFVAYALREVVGREPTDSGLLKALRTAPILMAQGTRTREALYTNEANGDYVQIRLDRSNIQSSLCIVKNVEGKIGKFEIVLDSLDFEENCDQMNSLDSKALILVNLLLDRFQ
jgi:hypothetical protein